MNRILASVHAFFNIFIDFFYRDPVERSIVNFVTQRPIFSGQIWLLPHLGEVLIEEEDEKYIVYRVLSREFEDDYGRLYRTSRKNFLLWCRDPQDFSDFADDTEEPHSEDSDNVIQLNPRNHNEP